MRLSEAAGHWALVTGASSGIGREFVRQLAAGGMNVALVARRKSLLEALSGELESRYGVRTLVLDVDLAGLEAAKEIRRRLASQGVRTRLLCNCAALGCWDRFENRSSEFYGRMVMINAGAVATLTSAMIQDLASFPTSAVINVSSPAALQPVPYMAVYAASKAFVSSFSEALHGEWRGRGVLVQTMVPGPTATALDGAHALGGRRAAPSEAVQNSLAHLASGAPVAASARGLWRQRLLAALLPRSVLIKAVGRMFRPRTDAISSAPEIGR